MHWTFVKAQLLHSILLVKIEVTAFKLMTTAPTTKLLQYAWAPTCFFSPVVISGIMPNTGWREFSWFCSCTQRLSHTLSTTAYYICNFGACNPALNVKHLQRPALSSLALWIIVLCQSPEKCTYSFWYSREMIYSGARTKTLNFMSCIKG